MSTMVPKAGLEPAQYRYRRILSPLRLPISPLGDYLLSISLLVLKCNTIFLKDCGKKGLIVM